MKSNIDERLKIAVSNMEQTDSQLAEELRDIRSGLASEARESLVPQLESLRPQMGDLALETIVLRTGRPVLAVVNDQAKLEFRDAESEIWRTRLTKAVNMLGKAIPAVGRIEVTNHDLDWLGTGWLVAEDVIITNRHVAREFAARRGDGFVFRQGLQDQMAARIDFLEEVGRTQQLEFKLNDILYIADDDGPDVALLKVDQTAGGLASRIELSQRPAQSQQQVAVIGYPVRDSRIPEQALMIDIFGNVFDKKRLAPGQIQRMERGLVLHDCTTLGGNSGSVVLDLESGTALALHFSGRFLESNYAVSAETIRQLLQSVGRRVIAKPSRPVILRPEAPTTPVVVGTTTAEFTIPIRIRVEVGTPTAVADGGPGIVKPNPPVQAGSDDTEDFEEILEEARPEDYADRLGYNADFLGFRIELPEVHDDGDVLRFLIDGKKESELKYQHFSVVMSKSRRICRYSAVNINGGLSRRTSRGPWRYDPRIPTSQQILKECYGNAPKFSRGHMTRREDPAWGSPEEASLGNNDSMHATNVVPQMQTFNAGIWLELENYALEHARQDDMKIAVITGPVLRNDDLFRYGVQIPVTFWKVIAFIHDQTGEPCATGYTLSQEEFLRGEEIVFGQHKTAQVPLSAIEAMAGLSFPSGLRRLDPLERVPEARTLSLLGSLSQIRFS